MRSHILNAHGVSSRLSERYSASVGVVASPNPDKGSAICRLDRSTLSNLGGNFVCYPLVEFVQLDVEGVNLSPAPNAAYSHFRLQSGPLHGSSPLRAGWDQVPLEVRAHVLER